ncbi:hypothetical protein A2U01_0095436, partial [Trifolium medium]|nr:hypothetical protein [Trifolium medium]
MEVGNKTDSGLTQNSSEQSDRKFPATTSTVIPLVREFTAQQNSECHKESVEKMKIKGSEEATTTVE